MFTRGCVNCGCVIRWFIHPRNLCNAEVWIPCNTLKNTSAMLTHVNFDFTCEQFTHLTQPRSTINCRWACESSKRFHQAQGTICFTVTTVHASVSYVKCVNMLTKELFTITDIIIFVGKCTHYTLNTPLSIQGFKHFSYTVCLQIASCDDSVSVFLHCHTRKFLHLLNWSVFTTVVNPPNALAHWGSPLCT